MVVVFDIKIVYSFHLTVLSISGAMTVVLIVFLFGFTAALAGVNKMHVLKVKVFNDAGP